MERQSFTAVCEAVDVGKERFVEHMGLRYTGKVVRCRSDKLVVEAFERKFAWPMELCRPSDGLHNPLGPPTHL